MKLTASGVPDKIIALYPLPIRTNTVNQHSATMDCTYCLTSTSDTPISCTRNATARAATSCHASCSSGSAADSRVSATSVEHSRPDSACGLSWSHSCLAVATLGQVWPTRLSRCGKSAKHPPSACRILIVTDEVVPCSVFFYAYLQQADDGLQQLDRSRPLESLSRIPRIWRSSAGGRPGVRRSGGTGGRAGEPRCTGGGVCAVMLVGVVTTRAARCATRRTRGTRRGRATRRRCACVKTTCAAGGANTAATIGGRQFGDVHGRLLLDEVAVEAAGGAAAAGGASRLRLGPA